MAMNSHFRTHIVKLQRIRLPFFKFLDIVILKFLETRLSFNSLVSLPSSNTLIFLPLKVALLLINTSVVTPKAFEG